MIVLIGYRFSNRLTGWLEKISHYHYSSANRINTRHYG